MAAKKAQATARKRPRQERSRATVEMVLEAAVQVFRREGWDATTNRIALAAGVSIGTLYEYFPNKKAILVELARRHVDVAEDAFERVLHSPLSLEERLEGVQAAIMQAQRFPSHALALVAGEEAGPDLQTRATRLTERVLQCLEQDAAHAGLEDGARRARAAFGAVGELTARAAAADPDDARRMAPYWLKMAIAMLR